MFPLGRCGILFDICETHETWDDSLHRPGFQCPMCFDYTSDTWWLGLFNGFKSLLLSILFGLMRELFFLSHWHHININCLKFESPFHHYIRLYYIIIYQPYTFHPIWVQKPTLPGATKGIFLAIPGNLVLPGIILALYLGRAFLAGLGACILLVILSNVAALKYKQKVKEKMAAT